MTKSVDIEGLQSAADDITTNIDGDFVGLCARLAVERGMKHSTRGRRHYTTIMGLRASGWNSERAAVKNWANAARREIAGAGQVTP